MLHIEFNRNKQPGYPITVRLPGSKSISNRLLILNALAGNHKPVHGLSNSRDTRLLQAALSDPSTIKWFEDGATPFRFYLAYAAANEIECTLDGNSSLRNRSMAPAIEVLRAHGTTVSCLVKEGFAPLKISGRFVPSSDVTIDVAQSSQFASALLLVSPLLAADFTLQLLNSGLSNAYIDMSLSCMELFGTQVIEKTSNRIRLNNANFGNPDSELYCEADWSAASYFYALCACSPGSEFVLKGLNSSAFQGDSILLEWGKLLGVHSSELHGELQIRQSTAPVQNPVFDFSDHIDLAPAIIAACGFLGCDATFTHIENLKYKESDRIRSMQINLKKLGMELHQDGGAWKIQLGQRPSDGVEITIDTFDDHRIAMAFTIYALRHRLIIDNENCVIKSFPDFWNELGRCNFDIHHGA